MAQHNFASLYGLVRKNALIEEGKFGLTALCPVTFIRGERDENDRQVAEQMKYSSPIILSEDGDLIDEIALWNENDIVYIQGFIATRDTDKTAICPECGAENRRIDACVAARSGGNLIYIYPVFCEKIRSYPEQGLAHKDLIQHAEISNRVFLLGNVTSDPVRGTVNGKNYTRYQIAVNRKYCPKGMDEIRERTDYPWVYSYGVKADRDYQALTVNSRIYVDGAVQTRKYKETYKCTHCGHEYEVSGRTMEVLSYDTEYLSGCNTDGLKETTNI